MPMTDHDLRMDGLTAKDISYNLYAFRQDVKRWDRKVARARTAQTRAQYAAKRADAARGLAMNERRWHRLQIHTTLTHLRRCRAMRATGQHVSYTTDPAWLVEQALNRRAGWPDDPSEARGSCIPVDGTYPKKASGQAYHDLRQLSRKLNTPHLMVRLGECGQWRALIMRRLPGRVCSA
jgi:hypothetical protein